jgi:hypothetical protein
VADDGCGGVLGHHAGVRLRKVRPGGCLLPANGAGVRLMRDGREPILLPGSCARHERSSRPGYLCGTADTTDADSCRAGFAGSGGFRRLVVSDR